MGIGDRLREQRELLGLSQADFASRVGTSRRAQINFESGENVPNAAYLLATAELGCDAAYILTGTPGVRTDEETSLLQKFRAMPDKDRAALLRTFTDAKSCTPAKPDKPSKR